MRTENPIVFLADATDDVHVHLHRDGTGTLTIGTLEVGDLTELQARAIRYKIGLALGETS